MSNNTGPETLDGNSPPIDRVSASQLSAGDETLMGFDTEPDDEPAPPGYADDPTHIARYVILKRIGEGGMGVVYSAYDNELDRRVAIKLVHRTRAGSESHARVRREAQAMARLSHPNVVHVYEVAEFEGQVFVAMEFVVGPTLAEWTRAQPASPTRWRTILSKFIDVGRGLAAAHDVRLVHRDFKPANAIVGDDGRVRVLDFGIARASDTATAERARETPTNTEPGSEQAGSEQTGAEQAGSEAVDLLSSPLTRTGALIGTPAYMSPEQFERRTVDARSDQFSFCVALYEALYGERPFEGQTTGALVMNVLAGKVRPAPPRASVPAWVREIVVRGLATEPSERWPSMHELLAALERDPDARRRRQLRAATWVAVAVVAVLGSVWFGRIQSRERAEAEREAEAARELEALAAEREALAQAERDQALRDAQAAALRARDTARVLAARNLRREPDVAAALLRDTEHPASTPGWRSAAINALQQPLTRELLSGHEDRVVFLEASLDNRWLVSASFDGTARLWPTRGGPAIVLRHDDGLYGAAFDRKSTQLVTASRDGTARVYRLPKPEPDGPPITELGGELGGELGEELGEPIILRGATQLLWSAQFSVDGSKVVTSSRDGRARVHTLAQPDAPPLAFACNDGFAWWAELSPNGRWLAAACSDGVARVWSLTEPERPPIDLVGHTASIGELHWSPTMPVIVTTSKDASARLYRFTGTEEGPLEAYAVLAHDGEVYRARFSLDGARLVTSSHDRSAKVWTLQNDGALDGPPMVFRTDKDGKTVWSSDFSFDGTLLAIGRGDGVVQVHPLHGGPRLLLRGHTTDVFRVRFAPDGSALYSGSSDGSVRVWPLELNKAARTLTGHGEGHGEGRVTGLLAHNRVLASASTDGEVRVWNIEDPGVAMIVSERPAVIQGHTPGLRTLIAMDAFPRLLATADDGQRRIRLWRITGTWVLDTHEPLATLPLPAAPRSLALDREGEWLVSELEDGTLLAWSLAALRTATRPLAADEQARALEPVVLRRTPARSPASTTPVFTADGRLLASPNADTSVELWRRDQLSTDTPEPIVLRGHAMRLYALDSSPDSRRLVSTSGDHTARVWDLDAPEREPIVLQHAYYVFAAKFDPTSERVLTACGDTNAYLWSLADPSQPTLLHGAAAEVRDVAFSPDGKLFAAAAGDGSVRVWSSEGGEPIELSTDSSLSELEFIDRGRRLIAAGSGGDMYLWYLGDEQAGELEFGHLQQRLRDATRVCLTPTQRARFIGESPTDASAAHRACIEAAGR